MFETLFGAEVPPALKFFLAFVIVLVLIGLTAWLVRRFGAARFGGSSARGRQPRLAVVDAAAVDGRRRLVIIRRDNVEHLLMIGGPTDVVVEQNIVRAMPAQRDKVEPTLGRGPAASDTLTRPVPLGEGTMWPLQPQPQPEIAPRLQPEMNARPKPQAESNGRGPQTLSEESLQWTWPPKSEPQRPARTDTALNNLADELSTNSAPQKEPERPAPPMRNRAAAAQEPAPTPPAPAPIPTIAPPAPSMTPPEPQRATETEPDPHLAEIANRLEAALRNPEPRAAAPAVEPPTPSEAIAPPPRVTPPEQKLARAEGQPSQPKPKYDSLEEEMASLLGRPPGKT
jgi:flagellar biogenesis protein FliO